MRKIIFSLLAVVMLAAGAFTFTSCDSTEDESLTSIGVINDTLDYRNAYTTFTATGEKDSAGRSLWLYNGCCFIGQADNRVETKTRLERLLDELRGVGRGSNGRL